MKISKTEIISMAIVLISVIAGIYFYPQMPEEFATHWNELGEADGYMSKFWGLFIMPLFLAGLAVLLIVLPKIDPLKANIEKFRKFYDGFIILVMLFMLAIYAHIILWNLEIKISTNVIKPVGTGLLFFYLGILCENAKRNWTIGIRTPWTLSSDSVWEKTHKLGGTLLKIAGIIAVIGAFFQQHARLFILVPLISISIYAVAYSYFLYQKEKKTT